MRGILLQLAIAALATAASGQEISGTIQVSHKLTRRSVTPSVPLYQRGPTIRLGVAADKDPLDFERSHVLIYLEEVAAEAVAHPVSSVLSQQDRQFQPDLVVVPVGGTVSFPNMDPIFHNVFSLSHTKTFDLGSFNKGDTRSVTFNKPGIVSVYCHLHPNMAATVFVAPNRWYARADRAGNFALHDVPPGHYTIVAWHKAVGSFRQPVVVEAGQPVKINFLLPLADIAHADGAKAADLTRGSH